MFIQFAASISSLQQCIVLSMLTIDAIVEKAPMGLHCPAVSLTTAGTPLQSYQKNGLL